MPGTTKDSLRELCEIVRRSYMDVTERSAGTNMDGVLGVLSDIGRNVYRAISREGAPGIPKVDKTLARLTLEAYVFSFADDLVQALEYEGATPDEISSTLGIDLAGTVAERAYEAGYRPVVKVFGVS